MRLDAELVRRGLTDGRQLAKELIIEGSVTVDGRVVLKPSRDVDDSVKINIAATRQRFVSRAGAKLAAGLVAFDIDVRGLSCLDVGASTGGFVDCLLRSGANHVTAVDVGKDQMHPRLLADPRVDVHQQTDIRDYSARQSAMFDLVTCDVSFISVTTIMRELAALSSGPVLALVKPQFEVGRVAATGSKGVVNDETLWRQVLELVVDSAKSVRLYLNALIRSPILGKGGNVEFLADLRHGSTGDVSRMIEAVVSDSPENILTQSNPIGNPNSESE